MGGIGVNGVELLDKEGLFSRERGLGKLSQNNDGFNGRILKFNIF